MKNIGNSILSSSCEQILRPMPFGGKTLQVVPDYEKDTHHLTLNGVQAGVTAAASDVQVCQRYGKSETTDRRSRCSNLKAYPQGLALARLPSSDHIAESEQTKTGVPPEQRRETMKTQIKKLTGAQTRLERHVQAWINSRAGDYESGVEGVLKDLFHGGCSSGYVSHLIYYTDTVRFFQTHRRDITALLKEMMDSTGEHDLSKLFSNPNASQWDADDPLAQEDSNRNLLAWFGFEEAARTLADRNEVEI